jgi:hypothetical protein
MNSDGTVQKVILLNTQRNGDPAFRAAADVAQQALSNPACQPFQFPPDRYDEWQTFIIIFD